MHAELAAKQQPQPQQQHGQLTSQAINTLTSSPPALSQFQFSFSLPPLTL